MASQGQYYYLFFLMILHALPFVWAVSDQSFKIAHLRGTLYQTETPIVCDTAE